jgi:protocatechuate 4,5-dioxygenase, alpha chain
VPAIRTITKLLWRKPSSRTIVCRRARAASLKNAATVEEAKLANDYDDIPGTFVFDAQRSRQGYGINMFCMSLLKEENRQEFRAGEEEYLSRFPLTRAQKDTILHREWNRMLDLGGNIYFIAKLAAADGLSFSQVAAMMTGSTQQEYTDMMLKGGRPVEGNRNKSDWKQHG